LPVSFSSFFGHGKDLLDLELEEFLVLEEAHDRALDAAGFALGPRNASGARARPTTEGEKGDRTAHDLDCTHVVSPVRVVRGRPANREPQRARPRRRTRVPGTRRDSATGLTRLPGCPGGPAAGEGSIVGAIPAAIPTTVS